jgi:hypothetical protein
MTVMVISIIEFPQLPLNAITISIRLLMIFILIIETCLLFRTCFTNSKLSEAIKNSGLSILTFFISVLLLEAIFMFLPRTHGIGYSLANSLWFDRYWKPFNSYDKRDIEPLKNVKTNIFFVGDSFAAGHGIKNIEDRFSDIVRANLKKSNNDIQVVNLAQPSFDTKSEYESVLKFVESSGVQPDMIVLQYYGNDIDHIASKQGFRGDGEGFSPYSDLNIVTRWIVKGSYLFNYLYWIFPGQEVNGYLDYLKNTYANDLIFLEHMKEFKVIQEYSKVRDIHLLVILFPLMQEIELSKQLYIDKVGQYLNRQGIDFIDISDLIKDIPITDRIVNRNDAHPSLEVHRIVGEELTRYISRRISK